VERRPGARVTKVGLRVGDLAGVDRDALTFSLEVLVQGTPFEHLALDVQRCPIRYQCRSCDESFEVVDYISLCPRCQSSDTECVGGTELELAYMEIEE
jgi:hydrogenase nickel incorporation protein HypA/HybF